MTYEEWYAEVNSIVIDVTSKDADQIGEYPFLNDYEYGMSPQNAALLFIDYTKVVGK